MRGSRLFAALVLLGFAVVTGCSGGGGPPPPPGLGGPVSLMMRDTPPTGVTVLTFQVSVTGAVLNPGNVDLLAGKGPIKIEVKRLEVETALLTTTSVTSNTYTSLNLTFANPALTFKNDSSGSIVVGSLTCVAGAVCQVNPTGTLTATVNFAAPGLTITTNNPTGLRVDLNLDKIISSTLGVDFSASGNISASAQLPVAGELEDIEALFGKVANKGASTFDLQTTQRTITGIQIDSNTKFEDFDKATNPCTAIPLSFTCVANGQLVEVDARLQATGTLLAKRIQQENVDANEEQLEGIVFDVTPPSTFRIVVVENQSMLAPTSVNVGSPITVRVQPSAQFQVDQDGLRNFFGINPALANSFSDINALLVGQNIQVRRQSGTGTAVDPVVTDRVRLRMSRFTARVQVQILPNNFNVDTLPAIFGSVSPLITTIEVRTSPTDTKFEGVSGVLALNIPPIADRVSLRGLLFRQALASPVQAAKKVRKQP